jgi:hypothetical protein
MSVPGDRHAVLRRTGYGVNLAFFLLALLAIAVVVNYFAFRPELRLKRDATTTRAYSLSEQTRGLLDELTGSWTIALIMAQDTADPATVEQVTEVLDQYRRAAQNISIVQVDPTDPTTLAEYEVLLARLRDLESERIAAYEQALDAGESAFRSLQLFAQQQASQLETALTHLDEGDPTQREIQQRLGLLGLLGEEGGKVLAAVEGARRVTDAQPIPDYETARSILAQALAQWADELDDMARIYGTWRDRGDASPVLAAFAASVIGDYERTAQRLAVVADPLTRLPVLELGSIGRQLQGGEVALIIGPERSAVVPSSQLFPTLNLRDIGDGTVAFDRRFRGEQVISAAIRSMLVEQMPMVVFVHSERSPLLRENAQRADLVGVAGLLDASRFEVREWSVGRNDRPVPQAGQPVVWIVMPPTRREGLEPSRDELALVEATERLIADGASVMLNVNPSLLPRYRQTDPWGPVALPFNLRADTGVAIYEAVPVGDDDSAYQPGQVIDSFLSGHPICAAVHGQQSYFVLPVPLEMRSTERADVRLEVVAAVEPSPSRWLEADWANKMNTGEVRRGIPFDEPIPIVMSAERRHPTGDGDQRFMLVGSGGWLLSYVADIYASTRGGPVVLSNPGNQEMLLASVAWLAGLDELIAPSPVSRQVARLDGLDGGVQLRWGALTVLGLPAACLMLGLIVWFGRRG